MIPQPIPQFEITYRELGSDVQVSEQFRFIDTALQRFRHLTGLQFHVQLRNLQDES